MILKNKKADKIISVYWFAILFIVAAAIVYMVLSFYGKPYDIREVEAHALTNKIAGCLSEVGYLQEWILNENRRENFMEECKLNFEVENVHNWREQEQYYVEVGLYNFSKMLEEISTIKEGNEALRADCDKKGKTFPVCLNRSFYARDREKNKYQINILSIVRKTEKNVQ